MKKNKMLLSERLKLIHDYFEVDYETIWETVQQDIPVLKTQLSEI